MMKWSRSVAVLVLLAATPAAAQFYPAEPYYRGVISPGEVIAATHSLGLRPVSEPRLRGPVWVVRAVGRDGTLLRVVVDSRSGGVVEMHAIDRPRFAMRGRSYDPYGPSHVYRAEPAPYEAVPPYADGQAVPDDDDDYEESGPAPRGYAPPHSSYSPPPASRRSAKPVEGRVASRPPVVAPLPKARPDEIRGEAIGSEQKSEKNKDADPAVASTPQRPQGGPNAKPEDDKAAAPASPKKDEYPVQPLE